VPAKRNGILNGKREAGHDAELLLGAAEVAMHSLREVQEGRRDGDKIVMDRYECQTAAAGGLSIAVARISMHTLRSTRHTRKATHHTLHVERLPSGRPRL
jgi:thymidylate kinase